MAWQPYALLTQRCRPAITCSCSGSRHRKSLQLAASHSAAEQLPPWSPLAATGSASTGSAAPGVSLWYATAAGETAAATKGAASCACKQHNEDRTHLCYCRVAISNPGANSPKKLTVCRNSK